MAILNEDIIGGRGFGSGGDGFGGGGLFGALIALALLGNRGGGFLGNNAGGEVPGLNNIQSAIGNAAVLGGIADIKGAIPLSTADLELALSQSTAGITAQGTANAFAILNTLNQHALDNCQSFAGVARDIAAVDTNVDRQSCTIQNVVHAEGEATRALIVNNQIQDLQAQKVILANEITELRNEGRRREDRHGLEITMTNNQNQNQLQFQTQAQQFANLHGLLFEALQSIRSTNSAINIGGTQLASPTNTNTNVKG